MDRPLSFHIDHILSVISAHFLLPTIYSHSEWIIIGKKDRILLIKIVNISLDVSMTVNFQRTM